MENLQELIYRGHWWQHEGESYKFHPPLIIHRPSALQASVLSTAVLLSLFLPVSSMATTRLCSTVRSNHVFSVPNAKQRSYRLVSTGLQMLPEFKKHFNSPDGSTLGFMSAAQHFGSLVALPFAPYISDGIGRRKTLSIGCFFVVVGVVLQVLAANVGHFIASRCISAFYVLSTRWAWQSHRPDAFSSTSRPGDLFDRKRCTRIDHRAVVPDNERVTHRPLQYGLVLWFHLLGLGMLCYPPNTRR